MQRFKRLPDHIGVIPDGNRRWALKNGMQKQDGYSFGISPGFAFYKECLELGIKEITLYGFTQDNTKRPAIQTKAFRQACVDAVMQLAGHDAQLLVVGNTSSPLFPPELMPFTRRTTFGKGSIKVNFLVNYGWNWDLGQAMQRNPEDSFQSGIASSDVSRIDLVIRWGGRRRLSGFLPVQTVYADFFVIEELWPDFRPEQLHRALEWYQEQDVTLGG
ncbi:MAG: undecaprenyl diphosphate synthase family protein [Bacillota bacterium]